MAALQLTRVAKPPIPDQMECARARRGDISATRLQRAAVPAFSGGRINPRALTPQVILTLQRTAGNQAVNALLRGQAAGMPVVQRCGATPCDCSPEEKATHAATAPAIRQEQDWTLQRAEVPGPSAVQREPKAPDKRVDVALVLTKEEQDLTEAHAYADIVLLVKSPDDARDKLKALGKPIGTLYVVSHSNASGEIFFSWSRRSVGLVPIADLGPLLKQGFAAGMEPITVDFRGCKVGAAGDDLESFRSSVGAQSAKGSTCYSFSERVTPLTLEGKEIRKPSDIPKRGGKEIKTADDIPYRLKKNFDQALFKQLDGLKSDDGKPVKNCLLGLAPGETLDEVPDETKLKKVWDLYWANKGNLVATWASPQNNHNWQPDSICWKDMTAATTPCSIVNKTAPAPGATPTPAGSAPPTSEGEQH